MSRGENLYIVIFLRRISPILWICGEKGAEKLWIDCGKECSEDGKGLINVGDEPPRYSFGHKSTTILFADSLCYCLTD